MFGRARISAAGVEIETAAVDLRGRNWQLNQCGQSWQYVDGLDRQRLLEPFDARLIEDDRNLAVIVPWRTVRRNIRAHIDDGCYVGFRCDDEIA